MLQLFANLPSKSTIHAGRLTSPMDAIGNANHLEKSSFHIIFDLVSLGIPRPPPEVRYLDPKNRSKTPNLRRYC